VRGDWEQLDTSPKLCEQGVHKPVWVVIGSNLTLF